MLSVSSKNMNTSAVFTPWRSVPPLSPWSLSMFLKIALDLHGMILIMKFSHKTHTVCLRDWAMLYVSSRNATLQTFSLLWGKHYLLSLKFKHVRGDCIGLARYDCLQSCQWQCTCSLPLEIGPRYVSPRKVNDNRFHSMGEWSNFSPWCLSMFVEITLDCRVWLRFQYSITKQICFLPRRLQLGHAICLPKKFEC